MQIKLDAKAVRTLIDDDEDFKLDLQRAVVAEIIKKSLFKDFNAILKYISPEDIAKIIDETETHSQIVKMTETCLNEISKPLYWGSRTRNMTSEKKKQIEDQVTEEVENWFNATVLKKIEIQKQEQEKFMMKIDEKVEKKLQDFMDQYFERSVNDEVERRLKKAAKGI